MPIEITDPEVPRSLPLARLYLDDIEQIVRVFSQAERKAASVGPGTPDPPTLTFQVGNRRTTEIEELSKITKRTNTFTLQLQSSTITLAFEMDRKGTHWWSAGLTRADAWETFHKLEAVLKSSHGSALAQVAPVVSGLVTMAAIAAIATKLRSRNDSTQYFAILGAFTIAIFVGTRLEPKSTAILRYSYEQAARREERNSKILFALLGAALGAAAALLGVYAKKTLGL